MIYIKLIIESLNFALQSLWNNKLRTFLSLLGITIGIFAIISVFSVIDSLRNNISSSIQTLGDDVVYVHKWPWEMNNPDFPWWKYMNRPLPKVKEYQMLENRLHNAKAVAFSAMGNKAVQYQSNSIESVNIIGASNQYEILRSLKIYEGRSISFQEFKRGQRVAVVGQTIIDNLFDDNRGLDKTIKIDGQKVKIIGVFEKEGNDMFNQSMDNAVFIPINFMKTWLDVESQMFQPQIMVRPNEGIEVEVLKDEIRRIMRAIRGIKPKDEDNFALNQTSMITKGFEQIFGIIDIAGIIIGGFSILVGAFGIANIMFVSVKERTKLIGIQKSLGAKSYFILFQFVFESIFLSIIGGLLGLLLVSLMIFIANRMIDMEFSLTLTNILRGIIISFFVGLLAGYIPARSASRLDPVIAINSNF
ncbi:MAG: ABC transporter permease [Bacteroidales bacterium]|nr:ABC transporter permease [Bacteroidales bacterium]